MKTPLAVLLACMFLSSPVAYSQSRKTDAAKPQGSTAAPPPAWDHKGHIRLCASPGDKRCTILNIPPGITNILGVVSTKVVPNVPHSFVILSRKNSYLCASGIGGIVELRCQRLPKDPSGGAPSPEFAAAQLQNTITSLLATRTAKPQEASIGGGCGFGTDFDMEGFCEDPGGYDAPDGFERPDSGGGGWDGGAGGGGYTDVGAAEVQATYQALADQFVSNDFAYGMLAMWEEWAAKAEQYTLKCSVVTMQCRDTCNGMQSWENGACTALGVAAGLALNAGIGVATAAYCGGKVFVATEECKAGCNIPQVNCIRE